MTRIVAWLMRRFRRDEEWREEIDSHLAMREQWNREQGVPDDEARFAARRQFGNPLAVAEEVRSVHISQRLENMMQDARYALRTFRKSPAFTLVAIVTIALGVGASTAVFSVVDPLLFRRLPYPKDSQLVSLGYFGPIDRNEFNVVASYLDWKQYQKPFQSMTSMRTPEHCDLMAGENPLRLDCYRVEGNFLRTFGVAPARGRDFTADDDRPNSPAVALLSYGLWRRAFGGSDRIVGALVKLDDQPVRVVGVLPPDFQMPQRALPDLLMPERLDPSHPRMQNAASFLRTFARLSDGVSIDQARAQMQPLFDATARLDVPPQLRSEVHLVVRSLRDRQFHDVKRASFLLLAAVLALFLVAWVNVANLMLARAAARRKELAVRAAIGATRGRLILQTLTESLVLGFAGCIAGCAVAFGMLRVLIRLAPEGLLTLQDASIDGRALLFALGVSAVASLLFGIAPAMELPETGVLTSSSEPRAKRIFFRRALVAAQVAISMVLVTGASQFIRSLEKLEDQALGFQSQHLVTATLTPRTQHYPSPAARVAFFNQVEERLGHLPGAGAFALSDSLPPSGSILTRPYSNMRVEGSAVAKNGGQVVFRWVTPGYFDAMRIPILRGRAFREDERAAGETPLILSESLARRLFGNQNPVGRHIDLEESGHWCPVVGVAADVRNAGLTDPATPEYYRLRMQTPIQMALGVTAVYRTALDPAALARWIRHEARAIDPALPVTVETMDERVDRLRERPRFLTSLVFVFAVLGLVLAAVGQYGVLSFLIAQQMSEIGVRMAIGARPRNIALHVHSYALVWTGAGVAAGVLISTALGRSVRGLLFDVSPYDPASLTLAAGILVALAALAAAIPSIRAMRIDPIAALRHE